MNFTDLGLSEKTIQAIREAGIEAPTTVQVDVIPSILEGKDVFTIAPNRCGKTCSYVFPLIEIISRHEAQNILVITAGSAQSVAVSDQFAVFNKYHEITESAVTDNEEEIDKEANVIIASPDLLLDLVADEKVDLSQINILVVDDINLIKKQHQLSNLEKILKLLPQDKQNIVFTNRRSKETQSILDQILQTPEEIKIDRDKEAEAIQTEASDYDDENTAISECQKRGCENPKKEKRCSKKTKEESNEDAEAVNLMKKYHTFGRKTPAFLLARTSLAEDNQ